ncbi:hypothetical protein LINPERPRIM_LOCUS32287 [Linum perenne]
MGPPRIRCTTLICFS